MRSSPLPTAAFARLLLGAMGLAALAPLAACGGNVVVDGKANGNGNGGDGGSGGAEGGGGSGGAEPCVPTVGEGQKLKHVCLPSCPPEGEEQAALSPLVESDSCDDFCCTSTWISSIECGPILEGGKCCFDLTTKSEEICMGRPFVAGGGERSRDVPRARIAPPRGGDGWADKLAPEMSRLAPDTRSALSAAWLRDALFEHASIASFARFAMELLAVGAPADLVAEAQQAMGDEVGHARACFGLAAAYGGAPIGPGPLDVGGCEPRARLADMAEAAAEEGCVGETLSALSARAALAGARDPAVRAALERIATEEEAHAALSWRFVAWALAQGDAETTARVRRVFEELRGVPRADADPPGIELTTWRAHGRLPAADQQGVFRRGLAEVVRPCATALLASVAGRNAPEARAASAS